VLMLLLTSAFAPLAEAWQSSVPACCRVGGKHHCMGMSATDGFQSLAGKCPHHVLPAATTDLAAMVAIRQPVSVRRTETESVEPASAAPAAVAFGNVQKRGPPLS
jgi:hypothetical protein